MATRYYLPASGAAAVSPAFDTWSDNSAGASPDRLRSVTAKSNTALTNKSGNSSNPPEDVLYRQYVSDPIGVVNFNGTTFSAVIKCTSSSATATNLRLSVRLYHANGTFTTLLTKASFDSAIGTTAATRIVNAAALANVSSSNGDRLVVEFGENDGSVAARTVTLRFGDPSATGDYALTSALTTDLDPWMEFSAAIPAAGGSDLLSFFH